MKLRHRNTGRMHNGQVPGADEASVGCARRPQLAPLKDGLPPTRRAFAEDLRNVFLSLEISVRRYAARRHLDASSVTRYLSGDRVPPWSFVAGVVADLQEDRVPLTPAAEATLRDLHRAAEKTGRRVSEVQVLQDKLAEADEETRRIGTLQRVLEEALHDRQAQLAKTQGRCRNLEMRLEGQQLVQSAEIEVWQGEYRRLEEECDDLRQEVTYLQAALTETRTELIAAEEECHQLETRLETLQKLDQDGTPSLMFVLEEADRTASVPELVQAVEDLELRTRRAMASELVRSASQSRTIEEVAGLLAALQQAGFEAHVQAALPAMVMARSVDDTSALARALFREELEECVLTLLRASVEYHQAEDVAAFGLALHRAGLHEHAESLLGAVAAVRPVDDLVSATKALADGELDDAMTAAMSTAAGRRNVTDLAALSHALREARLDRFADALQLTAAAERSASDVMHLSDSLSLLGLDQDAENVFDGTQSRGVAHLVALAYVLLQAHRYDHAWTVLRRAAETRPTDDIAFLITDFYGTGRHQNAAELLILAVRARNTSQIRELISALDRVFPGSRSIVRTAARTSKPQDIAAFLICLERCKLPSHAKAVFQHTMIDHGIRHLGEFLSALDQAGSHYVGKEALCERAGAALVPEVARLLLALESASLNEQLDAVVHSVCTQSSATGVAQLMLDLDTLDNPQKPLAWYVVPRVLHHVVRTCSVADQAALSSTLEATSRTAYANILISNATAAHGKRFKDALKKERTRYERKGLSQTLGDHWQDGTVQPAQ